MRKKIFTLFAMLFCVLGLQAQDTRYYYWENNFKPANSITFSDGAKVAITGDESLVFEKGRKNLTVYLGTGSVKSFPTFKLAKNVQHTFTAPAGKRIATISFITYIDAKMKGAEHTYWSEVAGEEKDPWDIWTSLSAYTDTPYLPYDFITYPDDRLEFDPGLKKVTFTYKGEQLYGIFWIKLKDSPNEDIFNLIVKAIDLKKKNYNEGEGNMVYADGISVNDLKEALNYVKGKMDENVLKNYYL